MIVSIDEERLSDKLGSRVCGDESGSGVDPGICHVRRTLIFLIVSLTPPLSRTLLPSTIIAISNRMTPTGIET